ncbi:hypothetical protein [Sporanaerobacter acetigenes]|uniref:Uncharacterized protein n=1 Tax=Sporanaerobacter acetigenes DSM 13106 TaxID=1123281 RepID=A0A1M5WSC7_9FIRM|nr:hypothetical protein [Sporanaerobacter acetigenes]SHH90516.1 hypothetical protein SAMN02745180_01385 [Sporanaerobacter acetigenes DSM 13106]
MISYSNRCKEAYAKCIDAWNHLFNGRPVPNATFVNIFDTFKIHFS